MVSNWSICSKRKKTSFEYMNLLVSRPSYENWPKSTEFRQFLRNLLCYASIELNELLDYTVWFSTNIFKVIFQVFFEQIFVCMHHTISFMIRLYLIWPLRISKCTPGLVYTLNNTRKSTISSAKASEYQNVVHYWNNYNAIILNYWLNDKN